MKKILNIINFIRGVEPRPGREIDLLGTVKEQMMLSKRYKLPTTWLIQYDALILPEYTDFLKQEMDYSHEVGMWFEVVQPMAEAAGITWRGRYPWDWHVDKGFSVGYTPEEREHLADVFMEKFFEVWNFYPDSVGSWFMDAHLLDYLYQKYGITASCNCKDQWGTDGYTLWGGYWANAYYPSRFNSYMPATSEENQIPVPVFRMLGSDPIYQYDTEAGGNGQCVITFEAISVGDGILKCGGTSPEWNRWFLDTTYNSPCLTMAYVQAGQENSFDWPEMKPGLEDQFPLIKKLADSGDVSVETLKTSARRFKNDHKLTPATAVTALSDWQDQGRAAIWYLSRFHRIGFMVDGGHLTIRDWQLFNENYAEPFLESVCTSSACTYDALPVMDGLRWKVTGEALPAMRFCKLTETGAIPLNGEISGVREVGENQLEIDWKCSEGIINISASERGLNICFNDIEGVIEYNIPANRAEETKVDLSDSSCINYSHNGMHYKLSCISGTVKSKYGQLLLIPDENMLKLETIC